MGAVHDALVAAAPGLARPSRALRRVIDVAEQTIGSEPVVCAAAGQLPTGEAAVVVLTSARIVATTAANVVVMQVDPSMAVDVVGTTVTVNGRDGAISVMTPQADRISDALGELGVAVATSPAPWEVQAGRRLDEPLNTVVDGWTVIGGHGPWPVTIGQPVEAAFTDGQISLITASSSDPWFRPAVAAGTVVIGPVPYQALVGLHLSGAGAVHSDAGLIGGGFGLDGALIGMGIAAAVNALTSRTTVDCLIHLELADGELFLADIRRPPEQLRLELSEVFVALRRAATRAS